MHYVPRYLTGNDLIAWRDQRREHLREISRPGANVEYWAREFEMAEWLAELKDWDFYATLTYDPSFGPLGRETRAPWAKPPSSGACQRHIQSYVADLTKEIPGDVGAVFALEYTKLGWPHFHGLISCGSKSQRNFETVFRAWWNRRGYVKIARVNKDSKGDIAGYCAKYVTKEDGEMYFLGDLGAAAGNFQRELGTLYNKPKKLKFLANRQ